jgi:hypothetical protein
MVQWLGSYVFWHLHNDRELARRTSFSCCVEACVVVVLRSPDRIYTNRNGSVPAPEGFSGISGTVFSPSRAGVATLGFHGLACLPALQGRQDRRSVSGLTTMRTNTQTECPKGASSFSPGLGRRSRAYPRLIARNASNPERVVSDRCFALAATPLGLLNILVPRSQGSFATLGWRTESLWDSQNQGRTIR